MIYMGHISCIYIHVSSAPYVDLISFEAALSDASALQRLLIPGAASTRGRRLLVAQVKQRLRGELPENIGLEEPAFRSK